MPTPVVLEHHCKEHIGPPRIIRVTDTVWVAVGYDLANTILIKTSAGHVIVDVAMSPAKAKVIRGALIEAAGDAPIHTIIYTHSHIDHVGGASGWAANATRIWATDAVTAHFFKQYGVFRKVRAMVVVGIVEANEKCRQRERKGR
jgi:glyoxylase-like metal-dependent hydrolase (beta-lactamase superfamily II)